LRLFSGRYNCTNLGRELLVKNEDLFDLKILFWKIKTIKYSDHFLVKNKQSKHNFNFKIFYLSKGFK